MSPLEIVALVVGGLAAGFVNTLAGGGSLLTLPLLVLVGLPWDAANATSRVSVLLQSVSAVQGFARADHMDWRECGAMAVPTVLGAIGGAALTWVIPAAEFQWIAIALLIAVGVAMIAMPRITAGGEPHPFNAKPSAWPLMLLVGAYGGFLQAGVGYLMLAVFGGVLGRDLAWGNALKAALILLVTLAALPVLGLGADIDWAAGLWLGLGSVVGAQLAVRFALKASPRAMRLILIGTLAVVIAVALLR